MATQELSQVLMQQIRRELQQVRQWHSVDAAALRAEHAQKLTALVEVLEIYNCGSVGGFDRGQTSAQQDLLSRATWVLAKEVK